MSFEPKENSSGMLTSFKNFHKRWQRKIVYGRNLFIHQAVLKGLDDIPALTTNLSFTALNCNKENEGE